MVWSFFFFSIILKTWEYNLLLFTPLEFITSVLADCFSLEFQWQQVSLSIYYYYYYYYYLNVDHKNLLKICFFKM